MYTKENQSYVRQMREDKEWFALNIERIRRYGEPPVDPICYNDDATTQATMPKYLNNNDNYSQIEVELASRSSSNSIYAAYA